MDREFPELRAVRFANGEEFALLVDREGLPLDAPLLYSLSTVRNRHRAYNTLLRTLRSIQFLYRWSASVGIDLADQISSGELLTVVMTQALEDAASRPVDELRNAGAGAAAPAPALPHRNLEAVRPRSNGSARAVAPAARAHRLAVIRGFLQWWTSYRLASMVAGSDRHIRYQQRCNEMLAALRSSARQKGGRQWARPVRLGLSTDEKQTLLLATNPGAESNPFSVGFYQARNRLIVCTLLELGLRAGELLNLRTIDINFQARTLRVVRRPDDPEDPRTRRPKVKTRGREIELNEMLLDLLFDFVTRWRRSLLHAGRHPFLFISDEGQPLSRDAVHLLFITLRRRVPGLPGNLSAHTLRHTWNDDFTELMDREKISPEKEVQIRSYLMGWSPTGTAAAAYTKRSTQRAAAEYGLRLQTPLHNAPG